MRSPATSRRRGRARRAGFVRRALLGAVLGALGGAPAAHAALVDASGAEVANTSWASPQAQLTAPPGCEAGASAEHCRPLGEPGSPQDDAPAALAALGHPGAPVEDLAAALDALAAAPDEDAATRARDEALAILEGTPLPGRAYSGIPLLNWNAPLKVKRVPAGGTVEITRIRTPAATLTDTWLLLFDDPSHPYAIRWRVAELGGAFGGELRPAPLLADGETRIGGLHTALAPLAAPALDLGTRATSRMTDARGLGATGAREETRLGLQTVEVRMPPPRLTHAILDPSTRPGAPALAALAPATPEQVAEARAALGLPATGTPTDAQRRAAIARLAPTAPERQIHEGVLAMDPADLPGLRARAAQDRTLIAALRTGAGLPPGTAEDPAADVTLVLVNNAARLSRPALRAPADGRLRVHVVNRDGFAHHVAPLALHDRRPVLGAEDWGRFDWTPLAREAVPAGGERTLVLEPPAGTFALVLGDRESGERAAAVLDLERGPAVAATRIAPTDFAAPRGQAMDAGGRLWVALSGTDEIARITPSEPPENIRIPLPNGAHAVNSDRPPLAPADVAVDARGIVWATLALGNAIARIDPSQVAGGSDAGVRVYPLAPCAPGECADPFPPELVAQPTRRPGELAVTEDGEGNTLVWFAESGANRLGVLRAAPDGTLQGQAGFPCGCTRPLGLALDPAGGVWFAEAVENRIGHLTPSVADPLDPARARIAHYPLPSAAPTFEPELERRELDTSAPHGVAVDPRGRVWIAEQSTGRLAVLDPDRARAGTAEGIEEIALPDTPFGAAARPADLVIDRAGLVVWTDEYGDAIGTVDARGPREAWAPGPTVRPAARRSVPRAPVAATDGDLWVLESAPGLLTRVPALTAGTPPPGPAPLLTVDPAAGTVAGEDLREASAVEVDAAGARVAAPVAGGRFTVALGVPLRAGDVIRVRPTGPHPRAPLEQRVPALEAQRSAGGAVQGRATLGEEAAGGAVLVAGRRAPVDPGDGRFALPAGTAGETGATVTWTLGTPGARWRFSARVTAPPGPAGQGGSPSPAPPVATGAPAPKQPAAPACRETVWLDGRPPRPTLLRLTAARAVACLGAPRRRLGEAWSWPGGLRLVLERGRVARIVLTEGAWRSRRGGLRVGAPARAVGASLPGARLRARSARAVLALPAGRAADVRIRLARGTRTVSRIGVRDRRRADLGVEGRALLRRSAR